MKQFIDHLLKQEGISLTQHCRETCVSKYYVNLVRNGGRINSKNRDKVARSFGFLSYLNMQYECEKWEETEYFKSLEALEAALTRPPNYYKRQKFIDRVLSFLGVK